MRAGAKGQAGHLGRLYYLQILCFPLMGNLTTISWGLVQIKTNGDSDSWLRSGYCEHKTHRHTEQSEPLLQRKESLAIKAEKSLCARWARSTALAAQAKPVQELLKRKKKNNCRFGS